MTDKQALHEIYTNLKNGETYGYFVYWNYYDNKKFRFPYFNKTLYKTVYGNFGFSHYGSSAVKPTKDNLKGLIESIFETTPTGFLKTHITETQLKNCIIGLEKM